MRLNTTDYSTIKPIFSGQLSPKIIYKNYPFTILNPIMFFSIWSDRTILSLVESF